MNISFIIFMAIMALILIFIILGVLIIWYLCFRNPKNAAMVKVKFDYNNKKTSFYSKGAVIAAVLFWLFLLLVGITTSDFKTTATILGIISAIYMVFIIRYLYIRHKLNRQKKAAKKVPGKIVGLREFTSRRYSRKHNRNNSVWHANLIVEYENPYTFQKEEYVTREEINGSPFYYLKSLDVTVYYQDADHIWVEDFKRIKRLSDNIAYQITGRVDGKDPGVLRYEEWKK